MNRIITTSIVDPSKEQPFTAKSLDFLQNNTQEQNEIIMASIIGSTYSSAVPYILTGCTGSGTTYTAGYVMFGGEVYQINAASVGANTPVQYQLVTTPDPVADPVTFTDLTTGNVHNVNKYSELTVAGTGAFTSAQFVYLDLWINATLANGWTNIDTAAYKLGKNTVKFKGRVQNTTFANAKLKLFTLPVSHSPSTDVSMPVTVLNLGISYSLTLSIQGSDVFVLIDNTVSSPSISSGTVVVYLNGISFEKS